MANKHRAAKLMRNSGIGYQNKRAKVQHTMLRLVQLRFFKAIIKNNMKIRKHRPPKLQSQQKLTWMVGTTN